MLRVVSTQPGDLVADTNPPPPSSGSNTKYALIGLLLLGGAAVVGFLFLRHPTPKPKPVKPTPAPVDPRPTSLAQPNLILDVSPDAGPPDAGPPKRRIIYRYVRSDWDCDGNIPAAQAQHILAENRPQVRTCYEKRLKVNNTLQGNVSVMLRVDQNGKVSGVQVGGSLHDAEVFSCIRHLADTWTFPPPTGGRCAVVSAPFHLTPRP